MNERQWYAGVVLIITGIVMGLFFVAATLGLHAMLIASELIAVIAVFAVGVLLVINA